MADSSGSYCVDVHADYASSVLKCFVHISRVEAEICTCDRWIPVDRGDLDVMDTGRDTLSSTEQYFPLKPFRLCLSLSTQVYQPSAFLVSFHPCQQDLPGPAPYVWIGPSGPPTKEDLICIKIEIHANLSLLLQEAWRV